MKLGLLLALLTAAFAAPAQEAELDVKGLIDTAERWAQDNLDEDMLAALAGVTNWSARGDVVTLTGATSLRFRAATN